MNHYQKLATLLIRCLGTAVTALGILGILYGTVMRAFGTLRPDQAERFNGSFWYALLGLVLYVLARPLSRLLGHGLE
jgi:hypothetical protein